MELEVEGVIEYVQSPESRRNEWSGYQEAVTACGSAAAAARAAGASPPPGKMKYIFI